MKKTYIKDFIIGLLLIICAFQLSNLQSANDFGLILGFAILIAGMAIVWKGIKARRRFHSNQSQEEAQNLEQPIRMSVKRTRSRRVGTVIVCTALLLLIILGLNVANHSPQSGSRKETKSDIIAAAIAAAAKNPQMSADFNEQKNQLTVLLLMDDAEYAAIFAMIGDNDIIDSWNDLVNNAQDSSVAWYSRFSRNGFPSVTVEVDVASSEAPTTPLIRAINGEVQLDAVNEAILARIQHEYAENYQKSLIESETSAERSYVLNTNTKKFHLPSCSSVSEMRKENKEYYTGTRSAVISLGYDPCGICHP